jgi:hypothetical protein
MKQPNFICIGAPKCGTTTSYDILKQHPDVSLLSFKKPHFFDIDKNYKEGYNWYLKEYFTDVDDNKAIGEFTPSYFIIPKVSNRIFKNLGKNLKFILILRNPVDRAYSQYLHAKRDLLDELSFEDAISEEKNRLIKANLNNDDISYIKYSYINGGLYYEQIKRYLKIFPKNNIKLLIFENDIVNNIDDTIIEIEKFLNIEENKLNTIIKSNPASQPRFKYINKFLYEKNMLKKIMKLFLKSHVLKVKLAQFVDNINQQPIIRQEKISDEMRTKLNGIFINDVNNLEKLLNLDVKIWNIHE